MANGVNRVLLIGHVGKNPEIREGRDGGNSFANFTVAVGESWKDKTTGERKEQTEWFRISVSNKRLVDVVRESVRKGSKVYVEGKLQTRKYQDRESGADKYITEVVCGPFGAQITLLDNKEQSEQRQQPAAAKPATTAAGTYQAGLGRSLRDDLDDEIPF